MKKRIVLFLLTAMIFTFSACGVRENKLMDINEELYYEIKKLSFTTEKAEYSTDVKEIKYTIINISSKESCVSGDHHFELHYKTNDGWKMVNYKKDVCFNAIARILKPGETVNYTLDLEEYYYLPLPAGEYRLTDEYCVSKSFKIS